MTFANLLIEKQRAGVQVNILYDSIGSLETPRVFFDRMRAAGIKIIEFNRNTLYLTYHLISIFRVYNQVERGY